MNLNYYNKSFRKKTHQDHRYLTKLLYKFSLNPKNEVHYNELRTQKLSNNINTCGRHVLLRGYFYHIPLEQWQSIWKQLKDKGYDLDELAVQLSDYLNGSPIK